MALKKINNKIMKFTKENKYLIFILFYFTVVIAMILFAPKELIYDLDEPEEMCITPARKYVSGGLFTKEWVEDTDGNVWSVCSMDNINDFDVGREVCSTEYDLIQNKFCLYGAR